ncbi:MAG: BadM/Rrf2 family transcriptional regulator [Roseovarius sp. BRH_c41]|uniref:RrF2 family transcriptional regulator n=1 Tax=Roseovarius sp. BRH_c41 TaxID=1629709 RepID=UPI0005F1262B|nr:Rrf2 family transcriptional regulator [Roseovarius sp. BRH_c41]KJS40189.1 MAG: BadM/Rrf2 family transcriptional regulator [Roseovarius sp. BRH_c41]
MRLTKFTDYSLRVLLYAATLKPKQLTTIEETSNLYGISRAHLKKVVLGLIHEGFLEGVRGRSGGFRLAMPAHEINLGQLLRKTEPDFALAECFLPDNACRVTKGCRLPIVLNLALSNFLKTFDDFTLADVALAPRYFGLPEQESYPQRGPNLSDSL